MLIENGEIEENGNHNELMKKEGVYYRMIQHQFKAPKALSQ